MACSPPVSSPMGFPRQDYWTGFPCPSPGDRPNKPDLLHCWQIVYHLSHRESLVILNFNILEMFFFFLMWFFAPVLLLLLLWAGVDMFTSCECQRWPGRISTRFRRNWGQAFPLESFGYCWGGLFIYLCCQNGEQLFAGHRSFKMVSPSQTGLRVPGLVTLWPSLSMLRFFSACFP